MPMRASARHWSHKESPLFALVDRPFFHLWARPARRGAALDFIIARPRCHPTRRLPQSGEQGRSHIIPMTFVVRLGFGKPRE